MIPLRFDAQQALRTLEEPTRSPGTLATLAVLAVAHCQNPPLPLRDRILAFTDDVWFEIEERAAIMEHDGGLPCAEAEARAIAEKLER